MADLACLLTHGYFLFEDPLEQKIMRPYPPLGILYIASHLEKAGFEVDVFDSTFRSGQDFESELDRRKPPIVGLYANLMTRRRVLGMIEACRRRGIFVVVGGPDPAGYSAEYLEHGADVVVVGEGELTMEELIPKVLAGGAVDWPSIAGTVTLGEDGELVHAPAREQIKDLDAQPFPARHKIDMQRYVDVWREFHGRGSVSLITARGCPYKCTWCSHGVYGYSHRRRSPENVVDEIEHIVETYGPDMVWYADDVFTIHPGWMKKYAAELERRGLKMPFETISREDRLNESMVQILADMGCYRLWIGSESGSQKILDAMQRRTDAARVREMVRLLQRHDIEAGMFIMLGYDGEEEEDLVETVEHLKQAPPDQFLTTVAYPIKGTPYYAKVEDRIVSRRPWAEGSDRDHTVLGRKSQRYYRHATRWMVNEVAWHSYRHGIRGGFVAAAKAFVNARLGRLGMRLSRHELETGEPA